ncbi:MAG: hypothetical protein JXB45_06050 [Candidatus Krumholzibacteriota bacterium]|nr:hypothetical protein [Candidatus Krumholzibacteriota bacterium]
MEFIKSLSFSQVLVLAVMVAAVFSFLPGLLLSRLRRKKNVRARSPLRNYTPRAPLVNPYAAVAVVGSGEMAGLAVKLSGAVDLLDEAITSSLQLCQKLSRRGVVRPEADGIREGEIDSSALGDRIIRMRDRGMDERGIAEKLNLDEEMLRLYMHVGQRGE